MLLSYLADKPCHLVIKRNMTYWVCHVWHEGVKANKCSQAGTSRVRIALHTGRFQTVPPEQIPLPLDLEGPRGSI